MQNKSLELLQWAMVMFVLLGTLFMAIKNNESSIVFNLCTLCFGYYFGSKQSDPPTKSA